MNDNDLEALNERRNLWIEALCGEHEHSIFKQLTLLHWDLNSYRVINDARRYSPRNPDGTPQINYLIHNLLDRTFLSHILIALRRLTDKYPLKESDKDVYSIVSIIKDIRHHAYLLTRHNLFKTENIEYNVDLMKSQLADYESSQLRAGNFSYFIPDNLDVGNATERHATLDLLCGSAKDNRSEGDCIKEIVFKNLLNGIFAKMDIIETYVNKKIAHASTPENGDSVDNNISIKLIVDTLNTLSNVSNFIQCYILNKGISQFKFIQPNESMKFNYINTPLIDGNKIEMLANKWKDCESEYSLSMVNFDNNYTSFKDLLNELLN